MFFRHGCLERGRKEGGKEGGRRVRVREMSDAKCLFKGTDDDRRDGYSDTLTHPRKE